LNSNFESTNAAARYCGARAHSSVTPPPGPFPRLPFSLSVQPRALPPHPSDHRSTLAASEPPVMAKSEPPPSPPFLGELNLLHHLSLTQVVSHLTSFYPRCRSTPKPPTENTAAHCRLFPSSSPDLHGASPPPQILSGATPDASSCSPRKPCSRRARHHVAARAAPVPWAAFPAGLGQ
jgi:hypothetical protein